ncbi:VOC family protein [Rhizobium sp. WYJ-E13]|uniref:VOC family protein n=1 Tax=unclassified Rhizobium TaxID=2613769 RepID=UPI001C1EC669|nr:VOC family protein [Rhizobium sp. WYJ-E13]QWW71050.1 VOC family protein [Rhizobium sp. WYJ-E13]
MPAFAQVNPITDICFLVEDIDRAAAFYVDSLGFQPRRRAPGFADFKGAGVTLALWEIDHIAQNTGVSGLKAPPGVHKACAAIELSSPAAVDAAYAELAAAGVTFQGPPQDYSWNARCCYFADPDDNLWELYAWAEGGPVGDLD